LDVGFHLQLLDTPASSIGHTLAIGYGFHRQRVQAIGVPLRYATSEGADLISDDSFDRTLASVRVKSPISVAIKPTLQAVQSTLVG
jgi:stage V sporulation protein SpoVS